MVSNMETVDKHYIFDDECAHTHCITNFTMENLANVETLSN